MLAGAIGAATGAVGVRVARDLPAGPAIVLTGAALFVLSLLFAPERGIIARAVERIAPAAARRPRPLAAVAVRAERAVAAARRRPFRSSGSPSTATRGRGCCAGCSTAANAAACSSAPTAACS